MWRFCPAFSIVVTVNQAIRGCLSAPRYFLKGFFTQTIHPHKSNWSPKTSRPYFAAIATDSATCHTRLEYKASLIYKYYTIHSWLLQQFNGQHYGYTITRLRRKILLEISFEKASPFPRGSWRLDYIGCAVPALWLLMPSTPDSMVSLLRRRMDVSDPISHLTSQAAKRISG